MTDAGSQRFVHIVDEAADLAAGSGSGPVLLVALDGFLDAGGAARIAAEQVLGADPGPVVASFAVDAFYDYRARRPSMVFSEDHYEQYAAPRLVVRRQVDAAGTPYLLLHGPEPDTYWEAFARAVLEVVEHFGVRTTVSMGSVPMAVPHTRPVMLTQHANRPELLVQPNVWRGAIQIPSSAIALLELRLGEWGHDATGFVAHVPHYVAQLDYPAGSAKLLESLEVVTGLQWELGALHTAAREREAELAQQVADSDEVRHVVSGLEQQYDAFTRAQAEGGLTLVEDERSGLAGSKLPTAEELGAEFERFLAGLDRDDD